MSELYSLTVRDLADRMGRGECSSVEVVNSLLERIENLDGEIGAYLSVDKERALDEARASDRRRETGQGLSPLDGIPIGVKDIFNVAGEECRCGSRILEGYVAPYDATAVARLRAKGMILLGRLNMDEFAMGSSTENSAYGVTRNPWNRNLVPGGSSGGSAAAVSADMAFASLATDTGGSIRQPAAFCGCVGLKPTYGRVSRYGLTAYASSLDQAGVITKDVGDAALLLGVIAGHDPADATSLAAEVPDYLQCLRTDLKGVRIGYPREYFVEGVEKDVARSVQGAIEECRRLGAEVIEVSLPHTEYAVAAYYIIATAEASANLARFDGVRYGLRAGGRDPLEMYAETRAAGFGREVKRRIILGTYVLSSGYYDAYYLRAQKVRSLIRADFQEAFKVCDVILAPTAPGAAFAVGERTQDPLRMYLGDIFTVTANLAGICGISVPCGFTDDGRPVGLQILGPAMGEEKILRTAYAYEQATPWHTRRPPIAGKEGVE